VVFVIITHKLDRKKCFRLKQESKQTNKESSSNSNSTLTLWTSGHLQGKEEHLTHWKIINKVN